MLIVGVLSFVAEVTEELASSEVTWLKSLGSLLSTSIRRISDFLVGKLLVLLVGNEKMLRVL